MANIPATAEAEDILEQSYDAGDEVQVANARKKGGRNRRKRLEMVEAIMQQPEGRKWFYDLMERCFIFGNAVVQGDCYGTYFNLGQQNVGKMILADLQEFPDLYAALMKEGKDSK